MWSRFKKLMAVINENGAEKENINKENVQPDAPTSATSEIIATSTTRVIPSSTYIMTEPEPTNTLSQNKEEERYREMKNTGKETSLKDYELVEKNTRQAKEEELYQNVI
ncbi:unnamed protein product [Parnassius apollo]|uniref:(apollo) hypothetical protein n=1 Tax=Parnassius apollo TaxID=110799 RepID=A0A8S3Y7I6_PARAO|nr:unnamed protein product [Parnassius apollo]